MNNLLINHFIKVAILVTVWKIQGLCDCKNITATGGGIVKQGSNFDLVYHVGISWERCYWSWFTKENR